MSQPLSASNARLKELRKLSRRSERSERRLFLADGPKAVEGALSLDGCVHEVFATPAALEEYGDLVREISATLVDERAMAGLSDSVTPAGIVALCQFFDVPMDQIVGRVASAPLVGRVASAPLVGRVASASERIETPLVAICADVRDPGNAGTVIRCADAAGADGVVLAGDAVDLYNPKTIRASVGSAFHLPVAVERDPMAAVAAAKAAGLTVLAADMDGESLFETDLSAPTAWLFGNEAWGLPDALRDAADRVVSIPIYGRAESLNISTAAAVCLYASARVHQG